MTPRQQIKSLSVTSDPITAGLITKGYLLVCDELDIDSKELIGRVRQATKDVVKSEV